VKRFARFLSMLLIASLAYATVGEAACAAEGLALPQVVDIVDQHDAGGDVSFPDAGHSCAHGHHHIDPSASFASDAALRPDLAVKGQFRVATLKPAQRLNTLERPPRI
jgi:hypothetical protein